MSQVEVYWISGSFTLKVGHIQTSQKQRELEESLSKEAEFLAILYFDLR